MAQGVPSFDTPEVIKRKAVEAIKDGKVAKYSLAPGILELREVIAQNLEGENKFYDFETEIIVTAGSIEAITATFLTILDRGDEVLIPDPSYTSYQSAIKVAGGVPVFVSLNEDQDWALDIKGIKEKITAKTKAILFCNPNNPTGTVFSKGQLLELAEVAKEHSLYILSDEVYKDFVYGSSGRLFSVGEIREIRDRVVYIFSFSKACAMTGWRVAFLATDQKLASKVLAVHDAMVTCAPVVSQYAALAALEMAREEVNNFKEIFQKRRDLICSRLDKLSEVFTYQKPNGAYFIFPRINEEYLRKIGGGGGSWKFAIELLEKAKVAVVPGAAFGPTGENHARMCFGRSEEDINEAFERMERFLGN